MLLGELIPYGATLYVAVALLARLRPEDIGSEADARTSNRLAGERPYFVGFSFQLAHLTNELRTRAGDTVPHLSVAQLYLLGLLAFAGAEDRELIRAYDTAGPEAKRP